MHKKEWETRLSDDLEIYFLEALKVLGWTQDPEGRYRICNFVYVYAVTKRVYTVPSVVIGYHHPQNYTACWNVAIAALPKDIEMRAVALAFGFTEYLRRH